MHIYILTKSITLLGVSIQKALKPFPPLKYVFKLRDKLNGDLTEINHFGWSNKVSVSKISLSPFENFI
jgi:hypothetical protein